MRSHRPKALCILGQLLFKTFLCQKSFLVSYPCQMYRVNVSEIHSAEKDAESAAGPPRVALGLAGEREAGGVPRRLLQAHGGPGQLLAAAWSFDETSFAQRTFEFFMDRI